MLWIKNTNGKPSASLTMTIVSFATVILWLLVWIIGTPFGLTIPAFDVAAAMGLLSPLLALYFGRRYTADVSDKKIKMDLQEKSNNEPDVA